MILETVRQNKIVKVRLIKPFCVCEETNGRYSGCWDTDKDDDLQISNIDDSYGLDVINQGVDVHRAYIPKGAICELKYVCSNIDFEIIYKNIECDVAFDSNSETHEDYFEIIE